MSTVLVYQRAGGMKVAQILESHLGLASSVAKTKAESPRLYPKLRLSLHFLIPSGR